MKEKYMYSEYKKGFLAGIPIALGYLPVSFTFGFMASANGLPVWLALFISMTNLTSAGQFAGTNLILAGSGYFEIALTTFVINIRYMLMSFALSQKIKKETSLKNRMLFAFGITDEIFAVAVSVPEKLSHRYLFGLILGPYIGWSLGTFLGAEASGVLPVPLQNAMGIALYAMFIAIIIPPSKKSRAIVCVIILAIVLTVLMKYVSFFSSISTGFQTILATIIAATIAAVVFPIKEEKNDNF